jgi:uncharacterized membrane protein YphA (DoxX/SURF4 family)
MTSALDRLGLAGALPVLARWLVGGLFIYMGLSKALHPVEFLKLVRQYDVLHHHLLLNLVASVLPWVEIFCGALLVLGFAIRGVSLVLIGMLIPFTVLVFLRALNIYQAGSLPFCAIKFDCGCGAGEVFICHKMIENVVLTVLCVAFIFWRKDRFCLRRQLIASAT